MLVPLLCAAAAYPCHAIHILTAAYAVKRAAAAAKKYTSLSQKKRHTKAILSTQNNTLNMEKISITSAKEKKCEFKNLAVYIYERCVTEFREYGVLI